MRMLAFSLAALSMLKDAPAGAKVTASRRSERENASLRGDKLNTPISLSWRVAAKFPLS